MKSVSRFHLEGLFSTIPFWEPFALLQTLHSLCYTSHLTLLFCFCLSPPVEEITEYPDFVETNQISGAGNMLKTLDPILITIIAMSALGVFLGAICGVVLYCACSHGGMSDRNLSALENYNFELVDGVKLKKDKLNVQSSYSEAWDGTECICVTVWRAELAERAQDWL